MFGTQEIMLIVAAAAVLFGAERIPKLARGLGQAKKEFQMGQAEADIESERLRNEARARAEAAAAPEAEAATPAAGVAPLTPAGPAAETARATATPPHE